jgi:hypothetical protein
MIPTIFGFIILLLAFFLRAKGVIYLITICTVFGATAAAFTIGLGNATINPALFSLPFVVLQAWLTYSKKEFSKVVALNSPVFWLLLFVIWGAISAAIMPYILRDSGIYTFTFDRFTGGLATFLAPIDYTSGNVTQTGYLILSFVCVIAYSLLLRKENASANMADAVLWAASINAVAGTINLLQMLGVPDLLFVFKNATYVIMSGELAGLVRISGLFSETSGFSYYSIGLLGYVHYLWLRGYKTSWSGTVSILTLVLLLLSTSGTAYVGLAGCITLATIYFFYKVLHYGEAGHHAIYGWLAAAASLLFIGAIVFKPEIWTILTDYFNFVVGGKMESSSGQERSSWNIQAWRNFVDSMGLGTGLGSSTGSSISTVLISNFGWPGILFFGIFFWKALNATVHSKNHVDEVVVNASRVALIAAFVAANISARVFDMGLMFYIFAAGATFRSTK